MYMYVHMYISLYHTATFRKYLKIKFYKITVKIKIIIKMFLCEEINSEYSDYSLHL